jgi:hypothetical protein
MLSNKARIIYLACPYTDVSFEVRRQRFQTATEVAARLIKGGFVVFSPVTMTHPIDIVLAGEGNTLGSEFWTRFDEAFMEFCTEMVVLRLSGWQESSGIQRRSSSFVRKAALFDTWMDRKSSIEVRATQRTFAERNGATNRRLADRLTAHTDKAALRRRYRRSFVRILCRAHQGNLAS